ncbi:MAG: TonB-dependent receptor [Bacteroidaceae bacterium]|nr:TonB-dependent receptor [Bacteroidaceae bacterium]
MKHAINTICFVAVLSLLGSTAFAQSKDDSSQGTKAHELNPVVVTGTGTYHRADNSPVAVKVISAKELKDAQVTTLEEALTRLTTNVTTHTNGMGTFVNFNGISDDYIIILENGKRVSGDDRWARLSLANVKRIEIYSGAASALYGSDAIAGVINVITDEGRDAVSATSGTQFRSKGRLDQDINVDATIGRFSTHTTYTHHQADNWQVNHYQAFDEDGTEVLKLTGRPMSTGFHSNNISEKLDFRLNDQWSFYIRGSYYDNQTDRPQSATYFTQKKNTAPSHAPSSPFWLGAARTRADSSPFTYTPKAAYTYDLHHTSYLYGGGARWTPNSRIHLYLDIYSDNFSSKYDYWQTAEKESYEETRKRTHYVNETLRGIFRLASWNKLSAGAEFVQESLSSQSDNIDFETTNTYNLFAQDEVQIVRGLEGVVGLRYTQNDNFGAALTPNAGLFFHTGGFRLRASYAGGYRTPTLSQLYATDQAKTASRYTLYNTELKPEKDHFVNVNAEYSNEWMSVSVTGFLNKIRDMINYRTMTQAEVDADANLTAIRADGWTTIRQRDNIDKATLRGISASVKLLLPYGFTIGGGYTFTDSEAETQTLDKKTQQYVVTTSPVDKSVRHVGNVLASWDQTWNNYHLNVTINGHIQGQRYSSTYGYADAISQWDLMTRHTIALRNFTLEPGLGIENIFNQRDTSPWNSNFSTINPGRSLTLSLRMRY